MHHTINATVYEEVGVSVLWHQDLKRAPDGHEQCHQAGLLKGGWASL